MPNPEDITDYTGRSLVERPANAAYNRHQRPFNSEARQRLNELRQQLHLGQLPLTDEFVSGAIIARRAPDTGTPEWLTLEFDKNPRLGAMWYMLADRGYDPVIRMGMFMILTDHMEEPAHRG